MTWSTASCLMGRMPYVSVSESQHELTCKFKFLAAREISCTEILFSEKFLPHHSSCKFFLSMTVESPIWASSSWKKKDRMIDQDWRYCYGWLVGRFRFRATLSIDFFKKSSHYHYLHYLQYYGIMSPTGVIWLVVHQLSPPERWHARVTAIRNCWQPLYA